MNQTPLFLITGASGSGKTRVITELYRECPEHVVLDLDALWGPVDDWDKIKNIWIHVAHQMALNQRMTILCGTFLPWEFDKVDLKDHFRVYYIGLHCSDEVRETRLRARGWDDQSIQDHQEFNHWIVMNAEQSFDPAMPLIDTSVLSPEEVALRIKAYIKQICVSS
ncbi:hypothetical protein BVG16_27320 [Paenibacillus selenitireducens]|uniref:Nucleoside kinase n=1 Tax=Paenibacillus selenitireducens TaxID=1324314 RepID=A0A1T2X2J2_9BACL|nr:AAA family ATPase [Paenibacillus selenitireducens]OPA73793.1 hypothetical protein BVG16_27320 [Paenibacillus selenitireducens]